MTGWVNDRPGAARFDEKIPAYSEQQARFLLRRILKMHYSGIVIFPVYDVTTITRYAALTRGQLSLFHRS